MTYAKGTSVEVTTSQQEIGRTLARYAIDSYSFGQQPGAAVVEFMFDELPIRVRVELPVRPTDRHGRNPETGRKVDLWTRHDQVVRERWRALLLFIKASLESCELGIVKPEQAFMAFLVTGNGETLGDRILPEYRSQLAIEA